MNYSQLFERAIVGIFQSSVEGRYLCANPAYAKMLGYESPEDLITSVTDIGTQVYGDPSQRAVVLKWLAERDSMVDFEFECRRKDGTRIWVRQDSYAVRDESGTLLYFEGFVRDISERKKSDEALRLARFTVDHATVEVFWIRPDASIADVNETACRTLGYSRDELLALRVDDIDVDHPLETWADHWNELRRAGTLTFPGRQRCKDGSLLNVEITANFLTFGGEELNCAFVRDITEQKRLSGDLEKLLDLSPDLICSVRQDGFCHRINKALTTTLGWTEEELLSKALIEFVHPDDRERAVQTLSAVFDGEQLLDYEIRILCKDGSHRWFEWRTAAKVEDGLLFAIGRDITARRHEFELMLEVEATANIGGWDLNFVTGELFWSRQMFLIHDLAPDSPTPSLSEAIAFYAPEARASIREALERGQADGIDWNLELPLITATGRPIWVIAQGKVELSNGVPIRAFGSFQDITDRKQAEVKLHETKASLRAFLDALQEPAFLMDANGKVLVSNDSLAQRIGTTVDELAGRRIFDFLPTPVAALRMNMLERVKQTRKAVQFEDCNRDRHFINYASPVVDSTGEVSRVAVLAVDITDRIKAEEGLRLFRALVDQTTDGIEVVDPETGRFLDVNERACTAHGYTRDEYLTLSVPDIDPLMHPETIKDVLRARRDANQLTFESQHRRKDGTIFPVEVKLNFVQIDREYVVAGVRDITERKHLEEQLRQSQKLEAIGRLAGGVAHDFNNLLTIIIGHAEVLLAEPDIIQHRRDSALEIVAAGERAAMLTSQLLAFSRKAIIEPRVLDLNHLVKSAVNMLSRLIGENMRIVNTLDPAIAKVKIDPGQMQQLLINLAVNARDAMPNGGILTFATTNITMTTESSPDLEECPPGNYVQLTVTDTGEGMTADVQRQIFEPFFTTKEVGKGTGLGLATVYGIVAQAKGAITVDSAVGRGTTFQIVLPAIAGPAESASRFIRVAPPGTETILLVEDDHHVRQLALLILETYGYTVLAAGSSEAARELAISHTGTIHLLLSDVVMPDFGGRELAEKVKVIHPNIAVLFISGYFDDAVIRHGIEAATDAFLQKPFTPQSLARKVRDVLDAAQR